MRTTVLLLACILLPAFISFAQEAPLDIIYIKDGSVISGVITKIVKDEYVEMRVASGALRTFSWSDITKMEKQLSQSAEAASDTSMSNSKLLLYNEEKKSPTAAFFLAWLFPSIGHIYAGETGTGLLFLGGEALCLYLAAVEGFSEVEHGSGSFRYTTTEINSAYWVGLTGLLVLRFWEMFDAGAAARRHNRELKEDIRLNRFQVGLAPTERSGVQMSFTYTF
ncbi:MAG: hypothetical protein WBQ23_04970 [Bacteroidota bacterium]